MPCLYNGNAPNHYGKPKFECKNCGRQFVENPTKKVITQEQWNFLPAVYQECAVCYTDFWKAYDEIFPYNRHIFVGKGSGKTSYIERFNLTVRQRVSRLVQKALSFSKKLENHIGAVWNFIYHYNVKMAPGIVKHTTTH